MTNYKNKKPDVLIEKTSDRAYLQWESGETTYFLDERAGIIIWN